LEFETGGAFFLPERPYATKAEHCCALPNLAWKFRAGQGLVYASSAEPKKHVSALQVVAFSPFFLFLRQEWLGYGMRWTSCAGTTNITWRHTISYSLLWEGRRHGGSFLVFLHLFRLDLLLPCAGGELFDEKDTALYGRLSFYIAFPPGSFMSLFSS
jgi:hypothetical protein